MFSFNEWLLLKESDIRGEYWIDQTGDVMYADGDVSDKGHEAHVLDLVQREILDRFGHEYQKFDRGEYIDYDEFRNQLAQDLIKEKGLDPDEVDEDEVVDQAMKEDGIDDDTMAIANGRGDAREYAMKHWGWKALRGHDVESWTLTPHDMQIIGRGIQDILDQEGYEEADDDGEMEFYVSAYKHPSITLTLRELLAGHADSMSRNTTQFNIMQKPLQMQAANAIKGVELQNMHPYYADKEKETQDRLDSFKKEPPEKFDPTSVAKKKGVLKPGEKWWALNSEGYYEHRRH